ncbi:hypothetical protein GCM10017624_36890 [Azotobacter vinelandii]|nr:hypothetical protein GCM10017624_36890 [Azotobacter vinelandii]
MDGPDFYLRKPMPTAARRDKATEADAGEKVKQTPGRNGRRTAWRDSEAPAVPNPKHDPSRFFRGRA